LRQRVSPVSGSHRFRVRSKKTGGHAMILLRSDCLLFQFKNGESVPCSAGTISVEIVGEVNGLLDPEMLRHAAASVFHYFKFELEREAVTIGEFSVALEKVLGHLGYTIHAGEPGSRPHEISEADLGLLARETSDNREMHETRELKRRN